ncbi:MAG: hypothetical protein ABR878_03725 [Roseiarcus sp.]|jgi:hypothetical protein
MRNIDDILVSAHKAMAASLHEAFEAGRAHTASELKSRMAAFFDGLAAEAETRAAAPSAPHPDAPPSEEQPHESP